MLAHATAWVAEKVSGRPYKVGCVVHGWSGVVGLARPRSFIRRRVILGSRRDQRGKATLYVKCLFFYTQRPLAFTPAPFFDMIR